MLETGGSQQRERSGSYLPKARVEAFSDGVFAIIVTILVLEVKVPTLSGSDVDAGLAIALGHAMPLVGAYAVSFMVVLVFWVAHHHFFHSLAGVDRNLLWLNGMFLMVQAFVPAPTALLGEYSSSHVATAVYGGVMALSGLTFVVLRLYVARRGHLLNSVLMPAIAARAIRRSLLSPLLYGVGIVLGLFDARLAWAVYFVVPLVFIVPGAFERRSS